MTHLLHVGAALALVGFGTSALVGLVAAALARRSREWTAAARARLLLTATIAPLVVAGLAVGVALAPSLRLLADHCDSHGLLSHPHLCLNHGAPISVATAALGAAMLLRVAAAALLLARSTLRAARLRERLAGASRRAGDLSVVDLRGEEALVLGLVRPRVFVSRALLDADDGDVVIAHEREHARRRDPLRRVVARFAAAFHLPGIAGRLLARLALAQEMAADEGAAARCGDRLRVAESILRFAHARRRAPSPALSAWTGGDLSERVRALLCDAPGRDVAGARALLLAAIALVSTLLLDAPETHHRVEMLLGLLS